MKKLIIIALFGLILSPDFALSQTIDPNVWDGKIYVKIKNIDSEKFLPDSLEFSTGNFMSDIEAFEGLYGLTKISKPFEKYSSDIQMQKTYLFEFTDINKIYDFIFSLLQLPYVEYAERVPLDYIDCTTTNEALNYWSTPSQTYNLDKVQLCDAWDISVGDPNIVIAIIDNEIQMNHEDLINKLTTTSFDVIDNDAITSDLSSNHGTHVAGIAGAEVDNSLGISGAARESKIMAVKVSLDGTQTITNGYLGILYAIQNNADVINTSWGGQTYSITHQNIINIAHNSGCVIVASAGNESWTNEKYPAAYNNVIAVGSTDENDVISYFSNRGTWIDIMAPGSNIYSAVNTSSSSYDYKNGTSMAAPLVAGICALIKSVNPNLSNTSIENCLLSSVDNIDAQNPSLIGQIGSGRVNALNAVNCAVPTLTQNIVDFTSQFSACSGQPVTFYDNSSLTGTVLNYSWSFSCPVSYLGGTNSNSQNPIITFPVNGSCDVTLEVTTTDGIYNITKPNFITIEDLTGNLIPKVTTEVCVGSLQQIEIVFSGGIPPYNTSITYNGITYNISSLDDVTFDYTVVDGANTVTLNPISGTFCSNNTVQTLTINPIRCCDNLIVNGDFELGNTGFTSDQFSTTIEFPFMGTNCYGYSYVDEFSGIINSNYALGLSFPTLDNRGISLEVLGPRDDNNPCQYANTLPSSYVALNLFNGTVPNHGEIIWQQSGISLTPNSDLHIDFYSTQGNNPLLLNSFTMLPVLFRVIISQGLTIMYTSPIIQPTYTRLDSWQQHSLIWNTGGISSGNYDVRIEQYENFGWGNWRDYIYLIDDISIRQETFDLTTSSTNATCTPPNSDGTASVIVSGGVAPYSYLWSDGQTTSTATGLDAGTFSVNVTDASGCQNNASVNVVQNLIHYNVTHQTSITGVATWNQSLVKVNGEVYVEDGATLTIANGTRVEFSHHADPMDAMPTGVARLIVKPGGNLIVEDNAILTGCGGGEWDGIRVLGTGQFLAGQGAANIGAATIENAYIGIANFDFPKINQGIVNNRGGQITASGTTFLNNRTGVYTRLNQNGVPYQIDNCDFIYNGNSLYSFTHTFADEPTHIYIDETTNFTATANNYYGGINDFPETERGYGIRCFDCEVNINNPVAGTQQFNGLTRAIDSHHLLSNIISVNNVNINNCQEGIYLQGAELAEINNSIINIASADEQDTYGVYLLGAEGTQVQGNNFIGGISSTFDSYGLVAETTVGGGALVYDNTFEGTDFGLQTQGENPAFKIRCNNFGANNSPHNNYAWASVLLGTNNSLMDQGADCVPTLPPNVNENQAGNEWLDNCGTGSTDVYVASGINFGYKAHDFNSSFLPTTRPFCSTSGWYTSNVLECTGVNKTTTSCNNPFAGITVNPDVDFTAYEGEVKSLIINYKNEITALENLIDAGNTTSLLSAINTKSVGNVKNILLNASPYLSDEVLLAYLNKTPPAGHVKQVIENNSPVTANVSQKLSGMNLPSGIYSQIVALQTGVSERQKLENQLRSVEAEIQLLINDLQRRYRKRIEKPKEKQLLEEMADLKSTKSLVKIYLDENNTVTSRAKLNQVSQTNTEENSKFCTLMNCLITAKEQQRSIEELTTTELQTVSTVSNSETKTAINAQVITNKNPNWYIHHPIVKIQQGSTARLAKEDIKDDIGTTALFNIYPNPSKGYFTIEKTTIETMVLTVEVYNLLGKQIINQKITNTKIDVNHLTDGVYLVRIINEQGEEVHLEKLALQK